MNQFPRKMDTAEMTKNIIALRLLALFAVLRIKQCNFVGRGPAGVRDWVTHTWVSDSW